MRTASKQPFCNTHHNGFLSKSPYGCAHAGSGGFSLVSWNLTFPESSYKSRIAFASLLQQSPDQETGKESANFFLPFFPSPTPASSRSKDPIFVRLFKMFLSQTSS